MLIQPYVRVSNKSIEFDQLDVVLDVSSRSSPGTPHRGSILANLAKALTLFLRPSAATRELTFGSAQLRDLNYWYRKYSSNNGIKHLLLAEGQPSTIFGISLPNLIGKVVSEDSADAGLPETPIIVDEDHKGISKPINKDAEVYIYVRDFVCCPLSTRLQVTRSEEALERNTKELQKLSSRTEEQSAAFTELRRTIIQGPPVHESQATIIDAEVGQRLDRIRKCRFFGEFYTMQETRSLVANLEEGDLVQASEEQKGTALAWCVRFLSGDDPVEAASILDRIGRASAEVLSIARSAVEASTGDLSKAIAELCAIGTPLAYGSAYMQVLRIKGFKDANEWLEKAGLRLADLDGDAKFLNIRKALEGGSWDIAFDAARGLIDEDWERTPGLMVAAADALLMQAVPGELRESLLAQGMPFDALKFPLRSEPFALERRRAAMRLYRGLNCVAKSLGLSEIAGLMGDKALWLRLVDPEHKEEGPSRVGRKYT